MTNDEINQAVAKALGFRHDPYKGWLQQNAAGADSWYPYIPNFAGSIDECLKHGVFESFMNLINPYDWDEYLHTCFFEWMGNNHPAGLCKEFLLLHGEEALKKSNKDMRNCQNENDAPEN